MSQRKEFVTGKLWVLEDSRYYTSIWAEGGHPNSAMKLGKYEPTEQWAVRRWVSSGSGLATISGDVGKVMPWGKKWTGHCLARIIVDGKTVYTEKMDEEGHEYSVDVNLKVGSKIDFLIGPGPSIGVTKFTAKIESKQAFCGRNSTTRQPSFPRHGTFGVQRSVLIVAVFSYTHENRSRPLLSRQRVKR